jgi:hypothetical protein
MKILGLLFTFIFLYVNLAFSAYVQPKRVEWTNSTAPDVAFHRVYVVGENETIDPVNSAHFEVAMPDNYYILPGVFTIIEGNNKVGVAAMDESGNISDVVEIVFPFDFTPPSAPTIVQVINN